MKAPPFNRLRQAGESLHHMIAHGDDRADFARGILEKFKINVDDAWNGVFLPATSKSPNPKGSIVHSMVSCAQVSGAMCGPPACQMRACELEFPD